MAKIGKETVTISGKWMEIDIFYSRKAGFYADKLPSDFLTMTEFDKRLFASEKDFMDTLKCEIHRYHEMITKRRKVILYKLNGSSAMLMNQESKGCYHGRKEGVSSQFKGISFCSDAPEYMFGFSYEVRIEVKGEGENYYSIGENGEPVLPYIRGRGSWEVIDWSEEREAFFKGMVDSLQKLINSTSSFFDQPDLLQLMETVGIKALSDGK